MDDNVQRIYASTIDGRANNARYRQKELKKLYEILTASEQPIKRAIRSDTEYLPTEIEAEWQLSLTSIREQYESIDVDKAYQQEYRLASGKNNAERVDPFGCVYLVPSRANAFYSTLVPLSLAVAAGNCVILELKQTISELNGLLRRLLTTALDLDTFTVVGTRPNDAFFSRPQIRTCDFSANASDTRVIAVVDRSSKVAAAARDIVRARFSFCGTSTYAPDVVLVNEFALKEFCTAVVQNATALVTAHVDSVSNGHVDKPSKTLRKSSSPKGRTDEGVSTLLSTSQGTVLIVRDRSAKLLAEPVNEPLLLIHAVSSLDDAIDFANSRSENLLLASYIFAAPTAAKYLSQFMNARITCVNQIPAALLFGPATPSPYMPSITSRFSVDMFQVARPEYIEFPARSHLIGDLLDRGETEAWRAYKTKNQPVLPPTGQPEGKHIGFFEQGLLTGVSVLGLTALTAGVLVGRYVVPVVWRKLR